MSGKAWEVLSFEERSDFIKNGREDGLSWASLAEKIGKNRTNKSTIYQWARDNLPDIFDKTQLPISTKKQSSIEQDLKRAFHALEQIVHSEIHDMVIPQLELQIEANRHLIQATWLDLQDTVIKLANTIGLLQTEVQRFKLSLEEVFQKQFKDVLSLDKISKELSDKMLDEINLTDDSLSGFIKELKSIQQTGFPAGAMSLQADFRSLLDQINDGFSNISEQIKERPVMTPATSFGGKPPPPPGVLTTGIMPGGFDEPQQYEWEDMSLEDIEAIPQETLESLSMTEMQKMRNRVAEIERLESMSVEEREDYLRRKTEDKARSLAMKEKDREMQESAFFKAVRAKADTETAGGVKGMYGKVTSHLEYWFCLECRKKFTFAASKTRKTPEICENCKNTNSDQIVEYTPALEID